MPNVDYTANELEADYTAKTRDFAAKGKGAHILRNTNNRKGKWLTAASSVHFSAILTALSIP